MTSDFQSIINDRPRGHVLAVCLHPAQDVTIYTKNGLEISRREDLGGKAINLARMLHSLGAQVTLLAPNDRFGQTGALLARNTSCSFDCELIPTDLSLRQNFKYVDADGNTREQNGSAGNISPQHFTQLMHRVMHICRTRQISLLALCGSFPQGVEKDVYKSLTKQAKELDICCVTDASGDALSLAVQAKPQLIKPNLQEFCTLTGQDIGLLKTVSDVEKAVTRAYFDLKVPMLCSLDKNGSVYAGPEGTYAVGGRIIEHVAGFAGAGDTMLASYIYARYLCQNSIEQSLRFASSAATAKVQMPANTLPHPDCILTEWIYTKVRKAEHEIYQK